LKNPYGKWLASAGALLAVVALAGCGGGSSSDTGGGGSSSASTSAGGGKGGTLTTLASDNFGTIDPAINYTFQGWQFLIITNDGLVGFKRAAGVEGTKIVADLATEVPTPTDGGKTYTFTLRKGIKYSDGTPLKASDFRFVMERQFKAGGPVATFYQGIVGGDACAAKPATCDLSKGVVADDAAGTVTFHLTAPDAEWLQKLSLPFAFAVPQSSPNEDVGNKALPGTGPYMTESYSPSGEVKLVRNPNFKEWSKEAQPDGLPDEIVQKFGASVSSQVTQVANNQADWLFSGQTIPADRLPELSSKYADRVHVNALTADWYFALNTQIPPFNNLKARQGVNYATDRNAIVKIAGGPQLAVPTCQILPPNFPAYEPYCPYTKNAGSGNLYNGPDFAKGQQLVDESGTKGMSVTVNTTTDENEKNLGLYFVSLLNKLGYKAKLQALAPGPQYPYVQNSKNKVQIGWSAWYQDYPAPSDFLNVLLGCDNYNPGSDASPNIAEFCDKAIQAKIDQALKVGVTDPDAANKIWTEVDHDMTDAAPWIDLYNPKQIDFLSDRVKGYTWSPQWYLLLDQMSVAG
jgi:peptide/nickel transport system substrate-binding protein